MSLLDTRRRPYRPELRDEYRIARYRFGLPDEQLASLARTPLETGGASPRRLDRGTPGRPGTMARRRL